VLAAVVVLVNLLIYGWLLWRRRRNAVTYESVRK